MPFCLISYVVWFLNKLSCTAVVRWVNGINEYTVRVIYIYLELKSKIKVVRQIQVLYKCT